jgi:hypothetical protein
MIRSFVIRTVHQVLFGVIKSEIVMGGACGWKVLMGKPERKRPLRKICRKGEYNIKVDLQDEGGNEWIHLALGKVP